MDKIVKCKFAVNATRGYGFFEGFLAKKRACVADRLIPNVSRKGRILDIGCGTYPYLLSKINFKEKYGLDQNLNELCKGQFNDINLQKFNIENEKVIPFQSAYFDIVTMLAVCEHLGQNVLSEKFTEVHRVLKPEGRFIITTPAPWSSFILKIMAALKLVSFVEIEEHKCLYSRFKILSLLNQCGFNFKKIKSGYFELFMNTWIIAEK